MFVCVRVCGGGGGALCVTDTYRYLGSAWACLKCLHVFTGDESLKRREGKGRGGGLTTTKRQRGGSSVYVCGEGVKTAAEKLSPAAAV